MKIYSLLLTYFLLTACTGKAQLPGYKFDNFKTSPVWDLAKAVNENNVNKIKSLLKDKQLKVDCQDIKFKQTLLVLSIVNRKREAFKALLEAGADPNIICGKIGNSSPFLTAIDFQDNCDLYYIENLINYGAKPNLEIKYIDENGNKKSAIPLLRAIRNSDNNGIDCLGTIKFLVAHGANSTVCELNTLTNRCEGVINECLLASKMQNLKYFVIEQKIEVPDTAYITGEIDRTHMKVYSLKEILKTNDYRFENNPAAKEAKDDILKFLQNKK